MRNTSHHVFYFLLHILCPTEAVLTVQTRAGLQDQTVSAQARGATMAEQST